MYVKHIYIDMDKSLIDYYKGSRGINKDNSTLQNDPKEHYNDNNVYKSQKMDLLIELHTLYRQKVEIFSVIQKEKRGADTADTYTIWRNGRYEEPDMVVNVLQSDKDKLVFALDRACVLIDENKETVDSWRAAGGTGIWFSEKNKRLKDELKPLTAYCKLCHSPFRTLENNIGYCDSCGYIDTRTNRICRFEKKFIYCSKCNRALRRVDGNIGYCDIHKWVSTEDKNTKSNFKACKKNIWDFLKKLISFRWF